MKHILVCLSFLCIQMYAQRKAFPDENVVRVAVKLAYHLRKAHCSRQDDQNFPVRFIINTIHTSVKP